MAIERIQVMNTIIQVQMVSKDGTPIRNWQDVSSLRNGTSQMITREMQLISKRHPLARVRAVDSSGRVVDML
jgi:hypothetical protein